MNPPRSIFLDLPLGHTTGLPNDREGQREIIRQGLAAGVAMAAPGIHDLNYRFVDDEWKTNPLGWSRKRHDRGAVFEEKAGGDARTARSPKPAWQSDADASAAAAIRWEDQCLVCIGLGADPRST